MCKARQEALSRELLVDDNEFRFLRSTKIHQATPLREPTVQLNIARNRHPNKRSKKNLDVLYGVIAPGSVVRKMDQHTSVICEPGNLDVTVRNGDIAKFGTTDERKTKLSEYINRRRPRIF